MTRFSKAGLSVYPLLYEEFLQDKQAYFQKLFSALGISVTNSEIESAIGQGGVFKKVHSDNISSFVENHQEVMERFGDRFSAWDSSLANLSNSQGTPAFSNAR